MDQKSLKTTTWQRIVIVLVAIILVGTMFLTYTFIVLGNGSGDSSSNIDEITARYDAKEAELKEAAKPYADKYFEDLSKRLSSLKAYNANNANSEGLGIKDLKEGDGRTLEEDDTDYFAYYVGWCPDGSVFDSSFDNAEDPTELNPPLDPEIGLIEGWNQGVVGMKLGGIRQLTISSDLAYGDSEEICGTTGSPLKFIIVAFEKDQEVAQLSDELNEIYLELYQAYAESYASSGSTTVDTTDTSE